MTSIFMPCSVRNPGAPREFNPLGPLETGVHRGLVAISRTQYRYTQPIGVPRTAKDTRLSLDLSPPSRWIEDRNQSKSKPGRQHAKSLKEELAGAASPLVAMKRTASSACSRCS